jgi:hypothetical protein
MTGHGLNIASDRESLRERIEIMEKERLMEKARAEELKNQLEEIAAGAEGEDPEKTWEALDHLSDKLDGCAMSAESEIRSKLETMEFLEETAAGVLDAAETGEGDAGKALKELGELLKKFAGLSPELKRMLADAGGINNAEDVKKALSKLGLTRKELERLLKEIRKCESAKCRMGRAGECSIGAGRKASMEDLKAFLEANCSSENAAVALLLCARPGEGGISRGGCATAMSWRKRELDFPHEFKAERLNGAPPSSLDGSVLIGRDNAAPKKGDYEKSVPRGFSGGRITSRNSNGFAIQPRYRGIVRDYFATRQDSNSR